MTEPPAPWDPVAAVTTLETGGARPAVSAVAGDRVETLSAGALAALAFGAARALAEAGARRGDVVALHAPNGPAWIATGLACGWLGAVLAPLDALTPAPEAGDLAAACGARVLVSASGTAALDIAAIRPAPRADAPPAAALAPGDPVALFRTSGTTGAPKRFRLSLGNVAAAAGAVAGCGLLRADDRVLLPLPLHHVYPWITATLPTLALGASLILPESAAGPHVAAALRLGRPTVIAGVPKLYDAFLAALRGRVRAAGRLPGAAFDAALAASIRLGRAGVPVGPALFAPLRRAAAPALRMLVSGGARLDRETAEALEAIGWDVRTGYGLSETASIVAGALFAKRAGTEGRAAPGAEIRIETPDAAGVGEIVVRGPGVFAGYLDDPAETARAFTADGFFRTGDLGRLDADGFLSVVGRTKEAIVLGGGETLFPEDVERRYEAHPDIAEIGVFERDGRLLALVRPETAAIARRGAVRPQDAVRVALAEVGRELPSTWRLSGFSLTREPLPRTRLGKLRRFALPALHDRAASGTPRPSRPPTPDDAAWLAHPVRAAAWRVLARELGGRAFDLDADLRFDLGMDSFAWMTLSVALEREAGARLDARRIGAVATVRDLMAAVTETTADPPAAPPPRQPGPLDRLAAAALLRLNAVAMRLAFRLSVSGAERLPRDGPLLLCPNHASDLDPAALAAALPPALRARTRWAADATRVFRAPLRARLARALGAFPVSEADPESALDAAAAALAAGGAVVWFPEGWRSPDGRLLRFQPGAGALIARALPPVAPVWIGGTLDAWPRTRRLPRFGRVSVRFGAPLAPEALGAPDAPPAAIAEALRRAVAAVAADDGATAL